MSATRESREEFYSKRIRKEILHYMAKLFGIRFDIDGVRYGKEKDMSRYEKS